VTDMGLPLYEWIKGGHGWSPAIEYYCGAIEDLSDYCFALDGAIYTLPLHSIPKECYVDRSYGYSIE
jgi:hypothetical protein